MPNDPDAERAEIVRVIASNLAPPPPLRRPGARPATMPKLLNDPEFERVIADLTRPPTIQEVEREKQLEAAQIEQRRLVGENRWRIECPTELQETNWADPRLRPYAKQLTQVRRWKVGKRGLYISGRSGRGKSRSFWDLMRRLMVDDYLVKVVSQTEVTRLLNRDPKTFLEEIEALHGVGILAWDDWGKFSVIEARRETLLAELEALIDARASNGRPMIFTSNCTKEDVLAQFGRLRGEPVLRRLTESCDGIEFGW